MTLLSYLRHHLEKLTGHEKDIFLRGVQAGIHFSIDKVKNKEDK